MDILLFFAHVFFNKEVNINFSIDDSHQVKKMYIPFLYFLIIINILKTCKYFHFC